MEVKMEGKFSGPVGLVVEGNIYSAGQEILTREEAEEYVRRLQARIRELLWDFFVNIPFLSFALCVALTLGLSFNPGVLDFFNVPGLLRIFVFAPALVSALCFAWRNQPIVKEMEWAATQKRIWQEALWRDKCSFERLCGDGQ